MKQELPVYERLQKYSLRVTSPWRSIGGAGKGTRACNYISNDVITLDTCFTMFAYIRARFRFALIGGNLTAQSTGNHRRTGGGIQIPETQLQAFLSFPAQPPERPGELARRL